MPRVCSDALRYTVATDAGSPLQRVILRLSADPIAVIDNERIAD